MKSADIDAPITIPKGGELLGKSRQMVEKLIADGWIKRDAAGKLTIRAVVQGYLASRDDSDRRRTQKAIGNRSTEARAIKIELETAVMRGELIPMEDSLADTTELVALFRLGLDSLPARLSRELGERQRIEHECDQMLTGLARAAGEKIAALESGRRDVAAAEEDHA